jgi:hypothetical protein
MNDKRIRTTIDSAFAKDAASLRRITTAIAPFPQQERSDQQPCSLHGNQNFSAFRFSAASPAGAY